MKHSISSIKLDRFLFLLVLFVCLFTDNVQAQNPYWAIPPYVVNFNTGTVSNLPVTTYTKSGGATNGIFNDQGNLKFYAVDNLVVNKYNSTLPIVYALTETPIVPIPEMCNTYCVVSKIFIAPSGPSVYAMAFDKMQYNTSTGAVTSLGQNIGQLTFSSENFGIAVSPIRIVNNLEGHEGQDIQASFLYAVGDYDYQNLNYQVGVIQRYIVTSSGIAYDKNLFDADISFSNPNKSFVNTELELSPNGNLLAWGQYNAGKVFVYDLTSTNPPVVVNIPNCTGITGVEFSPDNKSLFFSKKGMDNGVGILNLSTWAVSPTIAGTQGYGLSQLELAIDNKIYASNGTQLRGFPSLNPSGAAQTFNLTNPLSNGIYTLVDQIDYTDYNKLFQATSCIDHQVLSGSLSGNYSASNYINTLNTTTINSVSGAVTITAGNYLNYTPGFIAELGSVFTTYNASCGTTIDNCGPNTGRESVAENQLSSDNTANSALTLFPNPVEDVLNINIQSENNQKVESVILDLSGRKIINLDQIDQLTEGNNSFRIELNNLPAGVYLLEIKGEATKTVQRFIVK